MPLEEYREVPTHTTSYNPYDTPIVPYSAADAGMHKSFYGIEEPLRYVNESDNKSDRVEGRRKHLRLYPLSIVFLTIWVIYIIFTIYLLEKAVENGPLTVDQPWKYVVLPDLLLTIFAQGHTAVTATHLVRLGASALQFARSSPQSWAEVFWLADGYWRNPIGVLSTFYNMYQLRIRRLSMTFCLFTLTSFVALATPIVLSRGYPISYVEVVQSTTITPNVYSKSAILGVEADIQIGTGMGSWSTGLSVMNAYNKSAFVPKGTNRNNTAEIFFTGSIADMDASLPGMRLQGGCESKTGDAAEAISDDSRTSTFSTYCTNMMGSLQYVSPNRTFDNYQSLEVFYYWCTNATYWGPMFDETDGNSSTVDIYTYLNVSSSNQAGYTSGIVHCSSTLTTGTANISGRAGTFDDFKLQTLYDFGEANGGDPVLHPSMAMIYGLIGSYSYGQDTSLSIKDEAIAAKVMGFNFSYSVEEGEVFTVPSLDDIAYNMWAGSLHMLAGTGLLAQDSNSTYNATEYSSVSARVRSSKFVTGSLVLLASWALLLLGVSIWVQRPALSDGLSSYTAARLLLVKPGAAATNSQWELIENEDLRAPFPRVDIAEGGLQESLRIDSNYA